MPIGEIARRLLVGMTGGIFLLFGLVPLSLLTWALVVQRQPMSASFILLGYSICLLGVVLGVILLFRFSYTAIIDKEGVLLKFVLNARPITWEQISWYRYIGRRWRSDGKVTLLTLMKVVSSSKQDRKGHLILLELESREFKKGWRTRNYTSELNAFIPTMDRTRGRKADRLPNR